MSDFFNGLSILRTVGTGDGGFMHKTIPELEAERDWMESEEEYLKAHEPKRGPDGWTFGKPQSATGGEQKAPRAMDADEKELAERRMVLEAWRKHSAVGEGQVFETSGGERFVPNAQLEAFNKEMAKRGERPRRVQYFRTRGMMDEYGKTLTDAPVTLRWVEGDPKMAYVMDWFRKNPDAQGRMLPEMYRFLGITAEDAQREANDEQARRLEQQELRRGVARNAGKIGAAELSGMSVGFGGQSLTEQNKGKGAAKQTWNWFNARLNPVASLLDEYAQGTELELTSPDGMKTLRERQAAGKPLLTRGERLSLGLWGDVSGLNTPEAVQSYLADRIRNRQEAATEEEARGTTFWADAVRATEDSARMGIEFALVNAATGGGVGMGLVKGGVMKNLGRAVTRPGTLAEVGLHAPAKTKRLMEDKVAFDPQTGELKLTKEGESAWTAVPKAVGASALEYMSEMYTTDLLWKPLARGKAGRWAAEKGGKFVKDKLAPSAVGQFGRKLVEGKIGQGTARAMDALAAAPGMDAVRKIAARSGVNLNGVKGMVEESIGEELPANVISSMFNLEGESDRKGGLWGQVGGGASDAWDAFIDTMKASPSMALSVMLMGAGTTAAASGYSGVYNYVMSERNVKNALRELGVADEAMAGKSKAELNDMLFGALRDRKVDDRGVKIYDPEAIAKMKCPELERRLRENGWADMDLAGVSDEQLRQALVNGYESLGSNALVSKAAQKIWKGMVAAYGHRLNHGNVMERLEADIFRKNPWRFDSETRERMREVALLQSMAGSGQYQGTLAGWLMEDVAWKNYAELPDAAREALDLFEDGFAGARQTPLPTYEQIGTGRFAPSTFRHPTNQAQMNNNEKGGYADFSTGIRLSAFTDEGGKVRYRVDTDGPIVGFEMEGKRNPVDEELTRLGVISVPRAHLPYGNQNIFDTLVEARQFADRVSSWTNTLKQELLTKARAAQGMYQRLRGKEGNGLVLMARPDQAPPEVKDEIVEALRRDHPGANDIDLFRRFQGAMGFTSAKDGKVYVFLDNNNSPYALLNTIQHEGFHEGLQSAFMGDTRKRQAALAALMEDPEAPAWVKRLAKESGGSAVAFEELLAQVAETTDAGPGALRAVNRAMRKASALDTKGSLAMSAQEAEKLIYGSWKARRMEAGTMPGGQRTGAYAETLGAYAPANEARETEAAIRGEAERKLDSLHQGERAKLEQKRRAWTEAGKRSQEEGGKPTVKASAPPPKPEGERPQPEPPREEAGERPEEKPESEPAPARGEDTVPVEMEADEGEALSGEGALGGEPETADSVSPEAAPQERPQEGEPNDKKPAGAMSVAEAMLDRHPVVEQVPVDGLEVNKSIRQFKRGADLKTGVVPGEQIAGKWSGSLGRAIRVMAFKDGRREVITGRHRLDLARRNGMKTIPAIVYREADGMTVEKAHALDAIENVMDGKGTTRDYIRFFSETSGLTDAELADLGVSTSNRENVRNAFDIVRNGIDDLRVEALNSNAIPLSVLAAIARSDRRVQPALLADVKKNDTKDPTQVLLQGKYLAQGISGQKEEQDELFGTDDTVMREMRALALGVSRITHGMKADLPIIRGVINKEKDVQLRDDTAKRLGIKDRNDVGELQRARERLEVEIQEYESPTISGERRERAMKIGREALKKEEAKGVQGTLAFSDGSRGSQERPKQPEAKAPEPKPEPTPAKVALSGPTGGKRTRSGQVMPGESLEPVAAGQPAAPAATPTETKQPAATAKPAQALQDGETDANGFTRWHGFWVKPGTRDGEEGVYLYDKTDGAPTAFINKKPYVTKKGISRPGRVTTLRDDRDSAKRVRALYDWVERDKPKEQEPKRRPFEDDSIINKDALKDPKTLKAVADIFDKADRRTVVASEEGDVRVEYDVSKNGKPIPGTTRVLDKGRVMITDFAIDPKLGLDGSLSRTKKWIEGLNGGPKDTLAIYVNPETKAVRFTGRGAERVSQENGIDLEEVVPRMNREGIPVIVMIGNRARVAWPNGRPFEQEAPVSAPEAKTQEAPTSTSSPAPAPSKPQAPAKPKAKGSKETQAALDELNDLMGDIGMLREGPEESNRPNRRIRSFQTSHTDASPEPNPVTTPSVNQSDGRIVANPITKVAEKIETLAKMRETLRTPALRGGTVTVNGGNVVVSVATALDLERGSATSWYGYFSPLEDKNRTVNLRMSDHPVKIANVELADNGDVVSLVVHAFPRERNRPLEQSKIGVKEYRYSKRMMDAPRLRDFIGDVETLLRTGVFPNTSRGNLVATGPQTGMLREGPELSPEQQTRMQNAMNKVIASSVKNDGVRTFRDLVRLLFGMLRDANRKLWEAMKPLLRAAWVGYGDTHEALGLDEPSRAEARAIFEEVERGDAAQPQEATEPVASEPTQQAQAEPQTEPTATPAAPAQQQPAPPEPVAQAPQSAPQPATTDWASAKNGEIRLGEDGKAYIRWEDYWLTPATGKSRKWVGSRKRGRMETVEVEGVNVHDRLPDGKPGAQAKVFFEPDGRWVNPNNGKVHYGHMQALVDDPENGYRWTALDRWADDGNPRADMANAREAMERGTLGAVTEPQQKEDEHERTGIQSASGQVGGAVGGQEPSRDGGDGVGGSGAGVPGRGVSVPGGVDVSSGLAGEQPVEGVSDDAAGVGGRAGERGEDGGAVSRATLPVQPEGGDRGVRAGGDAEQSAGGDGGRGQGAAQGVQSPAEEPRPLTDDRTATANYVIPEAGNGGLDAITNARERIAANLAALRVLKALQKEGRQATVAEQRTLSLYTGWGSLGEQLFNDQNPDWAEERAELKGLLTEAEYASARRTVQYAHYTPMDVVRGMYDALGLMGVRGANLSAYEAGLGVGRFIGGLPEDLRGTRYTGVEMDPLTAAIAAQLYPQATVVNEKYQDVPAPHGQFDFIVGNPPYGNIKLSDRSFPDGNGQSLHNFFIMKQIEALRPGGVAAFLVTHYFLDAQDQSARLWIHQRAQFLGAIRMPNALFKTVDASLATDIVFFRKRLPGEVVPSVVGEKKKKGKGKKRDDEDTGVAAIPRESLWVYTDTVTKLGRDENNKNPDGLPLRINMVFSPNRTVYDMRAVYYSPTDSQASAWPSVVASMRYGKDRPQADLVVHGPAPTREGIYQTLTHMPIRTFLAGAFQPYTERIITEEEARERLSTTQAAKLGGGAAHPSLLAGGHFVGADGKLYYATKGFDGQLVAWPVKPYDEAAEKAAYATNPRMTKAKKGKPAHPAPFNRWKDVRDPYTKFTPKEQGIMKTIAALREVRFDLMQEELSENADEARMTALRKRLNEAYADFQKAAQGYAGTKRRPPALNDREIKALMFADPASSQLLGLETLKKDAKGNIVEAGKSAVFFRRVNEPKWRPLEHYDKAMDALVANLSETGAIDLDWIMARTGKGREAILDELRERVYIDPETERPVLREQYLSGDVKTKWEVAKQAVAEGKTEYARNVEALGTVIPADIAIEDLYVPFGSSIVTGEMVGRFAQSEMGFVHRDDVKATFNTQTGTWEVDVKNVPKDLFGRYFVANRSFKDVMKAALNNKGLTVYEKDEQGNSHPNKEATEQVAETIRQIRDQWEMWWPSSPFAAEIGKTYNARYNRIAEARYDGAFLKFQGLDPALTPYRHQRDAVWRTVVTGNVLYNHVVGSGKTNTAILSIMEMKRMGRVRKPVVVVPNHLVEQWRNDFLAAYPGANVLATDVSDLNAENRKRYFARIQNGDYDVIILPHSQLSRISLSPDVLKELVARQIAKYREALEELVRNGAERYTIKRIENMIERMEARIDAKIKALRTDETGIFFDTLGIDGLFLDEAHEFKNVPFVSAVQAKGMGNPSGSSKAFDLLMKVNWMRQKRAGAPVVFMTGTPVSNSLTELYLNMLYMAPDLLEKAKLNSMDAFLQSFGLVDERMEVATTGQFKVARRLRKLMNVPELMRMVRTYMDVIDADDLRGSMESVGRAYDVPELETGAPINVVAKRSPLQEIYFGKEVAKRQKADGSFEREFNVGSIYYRAGHMPQDPSEDNMLKLTNDAMAASLDIRLRKRELIAMGVPESELTDEALDFAGSKVNLCVAQIVKDYKRFDAVKGTQMVFCDRSIPGSVRKSTEKELEKKREKLETARKDAELEELDPTAGFTQRDEDEESPAEKVARLEREVRALEDELTGGGGFSVYDDIKRKLIAQGIPENEIAFIHSYNSKDQKQALFDRMNAGKVRVLLGSTSRMGAGTNANKRMVSMHHLDAPWRPSDMEQRNGRIIRQGNLLMKEIPDFKVRVYQYGTEKSADAFKFSTLLEKGRAFHGIYKRTNTTRNVEDIGEGELSSEQMMAQLSGSLLMPLMIEQREGVQTLERQARNHNAKRRNLVDARDNTDAQTPIIQDNLARARRVTELATERPDTKENYYAGIDLRDRDGNPIALNAKTMRERLDEQHGEPIAKLLHLGATIRYRGLEWVSTRRTSQTGDLFDVYEEVKAYAPNEASAERRPLVMTTQYDVNGAKDDAIIIRMNNAIDKARQSIPIFEGQLKANAEELAKLDRQLAEYPEVFPKNQELLEAKREFADIERCVNADATTAAEARVTLGHYYGQKGLPVPDYTWTRPEFDEKHGVKPNAQPSGMLREAAASVPFGEFGRWNQNLDAYVNHRLSLNKPVVVLRQTPEIIRRAIALAGDERFAKDKPITIRVENLDKITGMDVYTLTGKHKIPMDELRKLQLELDNPVAIFVSRTRPDTSIVVVTELMDKQDNAKAIIALQYARHPNGDYATLVPMNANVLSSVYGKHNIGDVRNLLYVNTEKTRAWEGASRLQLPFARVILANAQGLSGVLTEKDFSMDDKGKVLKNGRLVNPEDLGRLREPKWERELREHLAREGKTEADLSPETQAYLNAKREREAVMPKGAFGQASDFLGEAVRPREDETHWEFAKRKGKAFAEFVSKRFIDVRAPLIAAQREIAGEGLSDNEDVAKAMSLSYGRIVSRHADIDHAFVEPAMQLLADNGVGVSDLDIYLQATFAPERNKMIAERAEWKDAGAGITDEEAEKRLRGMRERLSPAQFRAVEEAARHIWKMNRENLRRLAESGILSADQVAEWLRLSPHYVPLRDDLERLGVEEPGAGGKLRKDGPFRKAVGRYSEALDSSVGWSVIQAKQGVIWAEQNRIARITLNFALNHKNPDDYYVSQVPRSAERVFRVRKGYRQEDAVPLRLDRPMEKDLAQQYLKAGYTVVRSKENPNIVWVDGGEMDKVLRVRRGSDSHRTNLPQNVVARVDGRRVYIFFNDIAGTRGNKMGLAINRANLVQWNNRWWNGVEWVTRVKAMLSTVWSPTFAITNAISDIMQTTGIMTTEGKDKILFDVYRNYTPALREVAKWRKGGKFDDTTEMGRWLEEAVRTGVLTGLRNNYMNFDQQMLDSVLRPLRQMERRGETWAGDPLAKLAYYGTNAQQLAQLISEVPEVGIRLAVYSALRKHGWGASDAALYAREITVDFNRKGEWTPVLNVLYMFSNAGIQSAARWWKALKEGTWGSRVRGALLFAIMGFVSQLWNRVASQLFGDDDDAYRNIPEWAWERSIPVVLPGGIQLNIPNRGMQAAFTLIGKDAADLLVGDITPAEAVTRHAALSAALENLNFLNGSASLSQFLAPTILDPFVQQAENLAWTGSPLHAQDYGNSVSPHWQDAWSNTSPLSIFAAKKLSNLTGGDEVRGGKLDVYPETISMWVKFLIGSVGTDIAGIGDALVGATRGEADLDKLVFARGVLRALPDDTARYHEARREVLDNIQAMQRYAARSRDKYLGIIEEYPYLRQAAQLKKLSSAVSELTRARQQLLEEGADTKRLDAALEEYRRIFLNIYEGKMAK